MPIAFDASSRNIVGPASSNTVAHTCTGSNRILWAATLSFLTADNSNHLTSVTYNGVAMTQVGAKLNYTTGGNLYLHYLIAPATGANNIVATFNATMDEIDSRNSSFTGTAQSSQPDADTRAGPTILQTGLQISVSTTTDNDFLVGHWSMGGAMTAGTNTTIPADFAGEAVALIYSTTPITPAGSGTLECTASIGTVSGIIASFKPVVTTFIKTVNGLSYASLKTVNGLAKANIKTINGLA